MFLLSLKRLLAALYLPRTLLTLSCFAQTSTSDLYAGVQIEFPAGGHLRIENSLGDVVAESWKQKYVHVTTSEGAVASSLASVVIENRNQGFVIRVVRRPGAPLAPIDLTIKFPESAQVEVVTGSGQISLRALPASATLKSAGGGVNVDLLESANVDIAARSSAGFS